LSKRPQKSAAHPVAVCKAGLVGNHVDRMSAALHHQSRSLDTKVLDVSHLVVKNGKIKLLREYLNIISSVRALLPNGLADVPAAAN
jgi:hypothetical protein